MIADRNIIGDMKLEFKCDNLLRLNLTGGERGVRARDIIFGCDIVCLCLCVCLSVCVCLCVS